MAVKAMDSVSVIDYTDVSNVKTWYLAVSRTSSAPTVAEHATEAQVRADGWNTTEPGVDITKKLYKVDQCLFGDGTYIWGAVSLSSSYEAAIQAYNDAQAAKKVATNYIMTHTDNASYFHADSNSFSPSTGDAVKITDQIDIIRNGDVLASFGDRVHLGKDDNTESYMELDYHSMKLIDKAGNIYFHISDLLDRDGYITDTWIGDGTTTEFAFSVQADPNMSGITITIDGVRSHDWGATVDGISFSEGPPNAGSIIQCRYLPSETNIKAYTLGTRESNSMIGRYSTSIGLSNIASGSYAYAEGIYNDSVGIATHAEGNNSIARGNYTHAEGIRSEAKMTASHAEGKSKAFGSYSHAEGSGTISRGSYSHAEGHNTEVTETSHSAHAEGEDTMAAGDSAHAEGNGTCAGGDSAHAEGRNTKATGLYSHAEGNGTKASNYESHAEGMRSEAHGEASHAQNYYTVAGNDYQTVIGKYNKATVSGSGTDANPYSYADVGNYAFIIGNGTANTTAARSNAFTVDWSGKIECGDYGGTLKSIFDIFYPVGSYYETSDTTFDPNTAWGGTWYLETEGQVHVSSGTNYSVNATNTDTVNQDGTVGVNQDGSKDAIIVSHDHKFTGTALGNHNHTFTGNALTGHSHRPSNSDDFVYASSMGVRNIKPGTGTALTNNWYGSGTHGHVSYTNSVSAGTPSGTIGGKSAGTPSGTVEPRGSSGTDANMQPYIVVNRWHRTA